MSKTFWRRYAGKLIVDELEVEGLLTAGALDVPGVGEPGQPDCARNVTITPLTPAGSTAVYLMHSDTYLEGDYYNAMVGAGFSAATASKRIAGIYFYGVPGGGLTVDIGVGDTFGLPEPYPGGYSPFDTPAAGTYTIDYAFMDNGSGPLNVNPIVFQDATFHTVTFNPLYAPNGQRSYFIWYTARRSGVGNTPNPKPYGVGLMLNRPMAANQSALASAITVQNGQTWRPGIGVTGP